MKFILGKIKCVVQDELMESKKKKKKEIILSESGLGYHPNK